jgi:hydrogenase maturation protease
MTEGATVRLARPTVNPILVATCGNPLAGDDAFGSLVADALRRISPPHVDVVDLGMQPAGLLNHLEGREALIVVDAALADAGFPAGNLIDVDFAAAERPRLVHDEPLSSHGLSLAHELELARQLKMLPKRVHLVAAAAGEMGIGAAPGAAVSALVEPAVRRILSLSDQFFVGAKG